MKSKEEILNTYNTTGNYGLPEMSAADLLNAMEAYKDQYAEAAFNAARGLRSDSQGYEFNTYADYAGHLLREAQQQTENHDEFAVEIALAANSVLPHFLPHDRSVNELSFNFTMQGKTYTAFYKKDTEGYWQLNSWN